MKNEKRYAGLHDNGFISGESYQRTRQWQKENIISLHWDLKTMLYLGVTLLSAGLGILVYKNIDTIGHQAILAFIALVSGGCFYYCAKTANPFSWQKVASPNILFDYLLLLGCLLMITFIGYLQYQYNVFGNKYGIASFIPMVILFFCAYYFDHLGILSLAITNFAAWLGISITPLHVWQSNNFDNGRIIFTGIGIGVLLLLAAFITAKRSWKDHFEFTYNNFATHTLFVSLLAAMFHYESTWLLWFIFFLIFAYIKYKAAINQRSFYFLVFTVLYSYVAVGYAVARILFSSFLNEAGAYLGILYFIGSAIGMIVFLINTNRKLKQDDSVQ
jgi:hypothetical protein